MKTNIEFGTIDVNTGETQDGYIDKKGNVCYKKRPWYLRLFKPAKPPTKNVYIGTSNITCEHHPFFGKPYKTKHTYAIYKEVNICTDKVCRIYGIGSNNILTFNTDVFLNDGLLVVIKENYTFK